MKRLMRLFGATFLIVTLSLTACSKGDSDPSQPSRPVVVGKIVTGGQYTAMTTLPSGNLLTSSKGEVIFNIWPVPDTGTVKQPRGSYVNPVLFEVEQLMAFPHGDGTQLLVENASGIAQLFALSADQLRLYQVINFTPLLVKVNNASFISNFGIAACGSGRPPVQMWKWDGIDPNFFNYVPATLDEVFTVSGNGSIFCYATLTHAYIHRGEQPFNYVRRVPLPQNRPLIKMVVDKKIVTITEHTDFFSTPIQNGILFIDPTDSTGGAVRWLHRDKRFTDFAVSTIGIFTSMDGKIAILDGANGEILAEFKPPTPVQLVALANFENRLLAGDIENGIVYVLDWPAILAGGPEPKNLLGASN